MDLTYQLVALGQIIVIDLVLAGDNAIVVGLAASRVHPALRARVIFWGMAGAVLLRVTFAAVATQLLTLVGLTLRCENLKTHPKALMIRSAGNLKMERCTMVAAGTPRVATAVRAEGRRSGFDGCEFRGFDTPLDLAAFPGSEVREIEVKGQGRMRTEF